MEWTDSGIVLSARRHGDGGAVATVLTRERGCRAGLARRGRETGRRSILEPGTEVSVRWRARLEDHLGVFVLEPVGGGGGLLLDDPLRLAALVSACAVTEAALPDHEPAPGLHDGLKALIGLLFHDRPGDSGAGSWAAAYVVWELGLLATLGFGLDLSRCAATGVDHGLAYVSPRTGRAVSKTAGAAWHGRLLPLSPFLVESGAAADIPSVLDGLRLAGYFLDRHVFAERRRPPPPARMRWIERLRRAAGAETRRQVSPQCDATLAEPAGSDITAP